jgi:uncharacterized protein
MTDTLSRRLRRVDWAGAEVSLGGFGYARLPGLLTAEECASLRRLYGEDCRFRSTVDMARHRFGVGEYRYFAHPLPRLVRQLRVHTYPYLTPVANRWAETLRQTRRFPPRLTAYLELCLRRGQTKPTPLLLRYQTGGYNCLHRDLYGEEVFPVQLAVFLSRPGEDYDGGAFLLVEQRPRQQSRGEALLPEQGDAVVFAVAERPVPSARGHFRAGMRHGVAPITRGERYTLGIIFHDAR